VVLDMEYAALNPADRYLAQGEYPAKPPLPHILGRDGVGTVASVGSGVTNWRIGQQAIILRGDIGVSRAGTLAEKVAVPINWLVNVPQGWNTEQAACAALVYLTAYQAYTQWENLPPKSVVLVTGASGGVGIASIHVGVALGYTMLALSRDPSKWPIIESCGATKMFDPKDQTWRKQAKQYLGDRRVNLIIDNVGGQELSDAIETLGDRGLVSCVGRLAGPVPNFNTATLFFRRLRLGGVHVGAYTPPEARAAWKAVTDILAKTGARPLIDEIFPFEELQSAFARLKAGPIGKVLIRQK
jgi:NADPH:quinone reductase